MRKALFFKILFAILLLIEINIDAQCVSGCNDNAYLYSSNPNTIEYDNLVSSYHGSIIKEVDGTVKVWGASSTAAGGNPSAGGANSYPTVVSAANGYNYGMETILKISAGENDQYAVLTTGGLYIWGATGNLVISSAYTKNTVAFGKMATSATGTNTYGLPNGVNPTDVKMMFGSYRTLAITTCTGDAWILSATGAKNGDGTNQNTGSNQNNSDVMWHRIKTGAGATDFLTGVVAMRGTANAMVALTSTGALYTWGTGTYNGDGVTGATNRTYATPMTLPTGMTGAPKMIGMTPGVSYFLLTTTGELWSLGANASKQLGDFTTTTRTGWVRIKKSSATNDYMEPVAWISPQEHDATNATVSILTTSGKLYSWGINAGNMIGGAANNAIYDPIFMGRGLDANDKLIALETGGHTTMVIRQCSKRYGYIGHRTNGSMGDGTIASAYENTFNFSQTAEVTLCGASTTPHVQNLKICPATMANLANAVTSSPPTGLQVTWYTTNNRAPGTQVANPASVPPGTYYAFYEPTDGSNCSGPSPASMTISYYTSGEPGSENCYCIKPGAAGPPQSYTKVGILTKASITNSTGSIKWPENVPNGHIVMDSSNKGFVITHMTTAQRDALVPVNGMMIYNTDLRCVQLYRGTAPTADASRTGWNCIERGCGGCTSNFIWAFPPAPVISNPGGGPYTAAGTINGINYTYTSSHTVQGTGGLYGCGNFPASYNVPCNVNPTIRNTQATSNTLTFASPITNPTLLFASVGSNSGGGNLSVPIQFSEDVEIVWSQNVVQNGPRKITGTEGFAIVRFNGTFSSISFNYTVAEDYCNFMFGADFMTCP